MAENGTYCDRRLTVLVSDDNKAWGMTLAHRLSESFKVLLVTNGQEAADVMASNLVDVIVTDVEMPVLDGAMFTVGMILGEYTFNTRTGEPPPIIVVTGLDLDQSRVKALEIAPNVVAIFQKPADLDAIHEAVACAGRGDAEAAGRQAHPSHLTPVG